MGIDILWKHLGEGAKTNIADYAAEHFQRAGRPLRIAVDEASWRYKNVSAVQVTAIRQQSGRQSNPIEKGMLYRVLRLRQLGIELLFVFDGPDRPLKKGKQSPRIYEENTRLWRDTLTQIGVPIHDAPGEAEAECSRLQMLGLVDAVWSEDGDNFMFGCTVLIRFHYKLEKGKNSKDNEFFDLYRAGDIAKMHPGLDRDGFVLHALMAGCDYDTNGLRNIGLTHALEAAKRGLGKSLRKAVSKEDFQNWRKEFKEYLAAAGTKISASTLDNFPDPKVLKFCSSPLVSDDGKLLKRIPFYWKTSIEEPKLQRFVADYFNFQREEYTKWIVPLLLIRSLLQKSPGHVNSNALYRMEATAVKGSTTLLNLSFLLSATTTLELATWPRKQNDTRSWDDADEMVKFETLRCVVQRAVPSLTEKSTTVRKKRGLPKEFEKEGATKRSKLGEFSTANNVPRVSQSSKIMHPQKGKERSVVDLTVDDDEDGGFGGFKVQSTPEWLKD